MSTARPVDAENTAEALHSAAIRLLRKLRRRDAEGGLNAPRLSALSVIVFAGPLTLGQLADAEQVRPPTMTRIVQALEAKGLVKRSASTSDRRTTQVSATIQGRGLLLRARARRVQSLAGRIANLTRGERSTLDAAVAILNGVVRDL
jgi:DNA-binding MarR family transcriptional regulator